MPPVPKFTKEDIIDAGLNVVREEGKDALTARAVAHRLGCSTSPIFTLYSDMDELKADVYAAAVKYMYARLRGPGRYTPAFTPAFKQQGILAFRFATEEPHLFLLANTGWNGRPKEIEELYEEQLNNGGEILGMLQKEYGLNKEDAYFLYRHVWIYTFAMASLAANGQCTFTEDEIAEGLTVEFGSILAYIKSEQYKKKAASPQRMTS